MFSSNSKEKRIIYTKKKMQEEIKNSKELRKRKKDFDG